MNQDNLWYSNILEHLAFHWSMTNLRWATLIKKSFSPSHRSYQSPITPHPELIFTLNSLLHARIWFVCVSSCLWLSCCIHKALFPFSHIVLWLLYYFTSSSITISDPCMAMIFVLVIPQSNISLHFNNLWVSELIAINCK